MMNRLEQAKVSGTQLSFLLVSYIIGSALISAPGAELGHDVWITTILGFGEGLIFAFIYISLAKRYPGLTLIEINHTVFGSILGKFVSLAYLWYFFQLSALILRTFGDFFITVIYPETPMLVILIMLALICSSAARNGLEVISRSSLILLPLTVMSAFLTAALLLPEMDFSNLRPFLEAPLRDILLNTHTTATLVYGETVAFLMLLAFLKDPAEGKFSYLAAFAFSLLLFLVTITRNIATLGVTAPIFLYPSFEAVRMVSIAEIITRIEVLISINLLFVGFLKISVLQYVTALGLAQLLQLSSYLPLILPLGSLMISLSILEFESIAQNTFFAGKIFPYYSLPFQLILPGLTLLISLLRRHPPKENNQ